MKSNADLEQLVLSMGVTDDLKRNAQLEFTVAAERKVWPKEEVKDLWCDKYRHGIEYHNNNFELIIRANFGERINEQTNADSCGKLYQITEQANIFLLLSFSSHFPKKCQRIVLSFRNISATQLAALCVALYQAEKSNVVLDVTFANNASVEDLNDAIGRQCMLSDDKKSPFVFATVSSNQFKMQTLKEGQYVDHPDFKPYEEPKFVKPVSEVNKITTGSNIPNAAAVITDTANAGPESGLRKLVEPQHEPLTKPTQPLSVNTILQLIFGAVTIMSGFLIPIFNGEVEPNPFAEDIPKAVFLMSVCAMVVILLAQAYEAYGDKRFYKLTKAEQDNATYKPGKHQWLGNVYSLFLTISTGALIVNAVLMMVTVDVISSHGYSFDNHTEKMYSTLYSLLAGAATGFLATDLYAWYTTKPPNQHSLPARLML